MLGAGGEHSELCHIGPCGDRRFGRSVGEFETCFWAGSSFWSCGFGRGGEREGGRLGQRQRARVPEAGSVPFPTAD